MAVYKEEKTNTWRAVYRYTDWNGERKQTQKRGFKTKREAQAWEREQLNKTSADLDMTFKSFVDLYTADMKTRLKENTWATKDHTVFHRSVYPCTGKRSFCCPTSFSGLKPLIHSHAPTSFLWRLFFSNFIIRSLIAHVNQLYAL